ncbi:MAG: hypothetical protein V3S20_06470 [Dehalococcoidia bacterium]
MVHVPVPTALNPAVQKALCEALELGMPLKDCAAAAGVGITSLHKWMAAGRKHPDTPQGTLVAELEVAGARFVRSSLETMKAAHTGALEGLKPDWKAAAWLLERRRPNDFSQRQEQVIKLKKEAGAPNFVLTPRKGGRIDVKVAETNGAAESNGGSG